MFKDLTTKQKISFFAIIIVVSGIIGWLYEVIFYYFNGGMKEIYFRGGNFLPFINIYAYGAILIIFFTKKYIKKPMKVFFISLISSGILEYLSGFVLFGILGWHRAWDYNIEILNFGNIGGFVCLRSVMFFGISSLLLIYIIVPFFFYLARKLKKRTFLTISFSLCAVFLIDELYNLVFARVLSLPRASDIYKELGFRYVSFK